MPNAINALKHFDGLEQRGGILNKNNNCGYVMIGLRLQQDYANYLALAKLYNHVRLSYTGQQLPFRVT